MGMKTFQIAVGGKEYQIDIEQFNGKQAVVNVNGKPYEIDVKQAAGPSPDTPRPQADHAPRTAPSGLEPPVVPVAVAPADGQIVAPMPGMILEVLVSVGDMVTVGTPVVKMEAMKMENEIPSSTSGTVTEIHVKKGDRVATDEILMTIEQG